MLVTTSGEGQRRTVHARQRRLRSGPGTFACGFKQQMRTKKQEASPSGSARSCRRCEGPLRRGSTRCAWDRLVRLSWCWGRPWHVPPPPSGRWGAETAVFLPSRCRFMSRAWERFSSVRGGQRADARRQERHADARGTRPQYAPGGATWLRQRTRDAAMARPIGALTASRQALVPGKLGCSPSSRSTRLHWCTRARWRVTAV